MSIKDFDIIQTLGKGSFGSVHKVKRKADGMFYAMKKVPFVKLTDKEKEGALNEVRLIASIKYSYYQQPQYHRIQRSLF
jgi:serine/threonine protein kinase